LVGALPLFLLWSCGGKSLEGGREGGSEGGSLDSGPVAQEDFVERAVSAICGNIGGCCEDARYGFDRAGCDAFIRAWTADRDAPIPNTVWDSAAAGRCIGFYTEIATSCVVTEELIAQNCGRLYLGTLPAGADCMVDFECADIDGVRAICFYDGTTANGRCETTGLQPWQRAGLGDPCTTSCGECGPFPPDSGTLVCVREEGLVCDQDIGVCVPVAGISEPCPRHVCVDGAYCDTLDLMCKAKKTTGAPCDIGDECSTGSCHDGVCSLEMVATKEVCLGE